MFAVTRTRGLLMFERKLVRYVEKLGLVDGVTLVREALPELSTDLLAREGALGAEALAGMLHLIISEALQKFEQ